MQAYHVHYSGQVKDRHQEPVTQNQAKIEFHITQGPLDKVADGKYTLFYDEVKLGTQLEGSFYPGHFDPTQVLRVALYERHVTCNTLFPASPRYYFEGQVTQIYQ